ncbi:MAG: oligosaccharide flippase family protein [Ferruginibacter sp.]|nr:oligosaccharide flippase family protein [Ferruginibacter sp.]
MLFKKLFEKSGLGKFISVPTAKNISTLMTGTVISAAIPILTAPIMSRIFTATDYGILGIYMSISGLIGVIAYSHYSQAIMLPKENSEARQVLWFSLFLSASASAIALIVFICLFFFSDVISDSSLKGWYFFIPLSIFLNGFNGVLITWANRQQKYKQLSFNRVIQTVITAIVQIAIGLMIKNETGLMVGLILGQLISVFLLLLVFLNSQESGIGRPNITSFKKIAVKYKHLLIYGTPTEFINNLINQTPIFLLQKFAGTSYVGYYNFTQRLLGLPQMFLSSAIVDVFKQKASYSYSHFGNCRDIFVKTFKALSMIAVIPFLIIMLFAPPIFGFVFGQQWITAGVFAQFLGIMFFFRFIVSPLSYVYILANKLKEDFLLHLLFLGITTASFYISNYFFENKNLMIFFYACSYSLIYLIYLARSYKFSKGNL